MRRGVSIAPSLAVQPSLDAFREGELDPGDALDTPDALNAWLRVLGTEGLRVVDASAMPDAVSAHPSA